MTTTSESPANSKDQRENSAVPLLAAVIGSVAGTLVTTAFNTSPDVALIGAALGAAIPPLVAVVGPFTHLRLGAGVLVAVLALFLTYSGFTITEKAAGRPTTTFPVPDPIERPDPDPSVSKSASPTPSLPKPTCEGNLCINWSPRQLQCSDDSCEDVVTVRSQGSKRLRVTSLEITGDAADRLSPDGTCEGASLEQDESCEIAIRVEPGEPGTAQLVIHQNLKGPASYVDIEVDPQGTPSPSPSPSISSPSPSPSISSPSPSPSISSGAAGP